MPELQIPLQPKQRDLLRLVESSPATNIGFGGARGGAKSHGGRSIMLHRRAKYPGTFGLIMRRKKKELIENHIEPLFAQFPFLRAYWASRDNVLTLPNGSRTVFGYAEHPAHDQQGDIYDFQGAQFMDILIDEATHFNEEELTFLRTCNRWPGSPAVPKMIYTMNPGNRGHVYCKRVFVDREFQENEKPESFIFMRAYGWDNVEWVRAHLQARGVSVHTYYNEWTEEQRQKCFFEQSEYGRVLNALKGKMRLAHALGDWEAFAGQFFDIFDPTVGGPHVIGGIKLEPWWPRWISIDWGYDHPSAVYWHAQSEDCTITYREFVQDRLTPRMLGQAIAERSKTPDGVPERISSIYLSPDAFAKRTSEDTIALQLDEVFQGVNDEAWRKENPNPAVPGRRFPHCEKADNDRIGGWMLMYDLLGAEKWKILGSCRQLIECIPNLVRDEDNREDVQKADGDDPADSVRYGLKSRLGSRPEPVQVRVDRRIHATEPTSIMIWRSKFIKEEKAKMVPRYFGRHWRRRGGRVT